MDDVVGAQQHVAQPRFVGGGQGALFHVLQGAQWGLHHHLAPVGGDLRGCKHAMANELGHKAGGGSVVERISVFPLVQVALVHHANHVANGKGLELVVCHKQGGSPCRFEDAADLVGQALAQVHIEVRKRLVKQQQTGAGRQGAGQGHTLLLAARQLVGVAIV